MKWNKKLVLVLAFALMLIGAGCSAANDTDTNVNAPAQNDLGIEQNDSGVEGDVQEEGALDDLETEETEENDGATE